jgi:hypothetical protein
MNNRREFLRNAFLAMGGLSLPGMMPGLSATPLIGSSARPPMRFIFMHRGNGLFPKVLVPPTLGKEELDKEKQNLPYEVDLSKHSLPEWMSPLEAHKDHLTIVQGLSGKMCTTGHHSWCSSLGVYKANERLSSIKWATVEFELAKLFPSPMEHIELACFPTDGGNARGGLDGIAKGFSARGPQQPNYAFGGPGIAVDEIFKSVSADKNDQVRYQLERKVLEFAAGNQTPVTSPASRKRKSAIMPAPSMRSASVIARSTRWPMSCASTCPSWKASISRTTWTPTRVRSVTPRSCSPP